MGAATITPAIGCRMGGMGKVLSDKIHDDLYARALVFSHGGSRWAIVSADLVALGRDTIDSAKDLIFHETGIPPQNICIHALHNHSGPLTYQFFEGYEPESDYMQELICKVAGGVEQAMRNQQEAEIGFGSGYAILNVNRRVRMANGSVQMLFKPPTLTADPDLPPNGPTDHELGIMAFRGGDGRLLGILANYSAHVICAAKTSHLGTVSADFPGELVGFLQSQTGAFAIHTNGACGNVHPIGFSEGFDRAKKTGEELGRTVLGVLPGIHFERCSRLRARMESLDLPYNREFMETGKGRLKRRGDRSLSVLQVMAINDTAFVNVPCELFVEIGLAIKRKSPFKRTFIVSNSNDYLSYVPTREAFAEGGYEPNLARHISEAGAMLERQTLRMLAEIWNG